MTDHAQKLWALHRDNVVRNVADGSLRRMVVNAVEPDGTIQVREVGTNVVHDEPYKALDSTTGFAVGEYVIVGEVMGRGSELSRTRVVLGRMGASSAAVIEDVASNQAATVGNTSSVVSFVNAISLSMALPAGTWTVTASGDVLLSHNSNRGNIRVEIDGNAPAEHTQTMVTEQRFAAAHKRVGLTGDRTITVNLQYKSFDAGTTTARNPRIEVKAVRTA
jgi:hypothetical protein